MDSFESRLDLVSEGKSVRPAGKAGQATQADAPTPAAAEPDATEVATENPDSGSEAAEQDPPGWDAAVGGGQVDVILSPLLDISLARAVESTLGDSEGISAASLRELRSDAAIIATTVDPGVSVVGVLRKRLPVSFKVVDSDAESVTIALTQPTNGDGDGKAVPMIS
jgi:hypothetical protein